MAKALGEQIDLDIAGDWKTGAPIPTWPRLCCQAMASASCLRGMSPTMRSTAASR